MAALAAGDLKSATLEGAALEIAQRLQAAEQAVVPATGLGVPNNVSISFSTDSNSVSVSFTLPIVTTISSTGTISVSVVPYA